MKLETKTLQIVKNFSTINPSILFKEGNKLSTISPTKTIFATANIDQSFPKQFAIYDLSKFLGVLSLFKEPELEFQDKQLHISSGSEKIKFTYADPSSIVVPPEKEIKLPSVDVEFSLTPETFSSVMKATAALSVPEIAVVGKNSKIYLQAFDSKNPTGDSYSVSIGETEKTFTAVFKAEYMKILPTSYEVTISSKGLSQFRGEYVTYWIAVEAGSSSFE